MTTTTVNNPPRVSHSAAYQYGTSYLKAWSDGLSTPGRQTLVLKRVGYKDFIVTPKNGGEIKARYKCGYPNAQRQFALLQITRRLKA